MTSHPHRPHRLRVSTMTALANPAYRRLDVWQSLEEAGRRLAATAGAGRDTVEDIARVSALLDQLRPEWRRTAPVRGRCGRSGGPRPGTGWQHRVRAGAHPG
jgi:hypothetical protein